MFLKIKKIFCPQKVAQKNSNPLFFLTALTAQTAQIEEFMFQNVAYRPTVHKTGNGSIQKRHDANNEYLTSIANMEWNLRIKQQQRKVCVFLSYFPAFATAPEPAEDLKIRLG